MADNLKPVQDSTANLTPGEWKAEKAGGFLRNVVAYTPDHGDQVIASTFSTVRGNKRTYGEEWAEQEANTRIMAASKDMLKQLLQVEQTLSSGGAFPPDALTAIQAVIVKAGATPRGGSDNQALDLLTATENLERAVSHYFNGFTHLHPSIAEPLEATRAALARVKLPG